MYVMYICLLQVTLFVGLQGYFPSYFIENYWIVLVSRLEGTELLDSHDIGKNLCYKEANFRESDRA